MMIYLLKNRVTDRAEEESRRFPYALHIYVTCNLYPLNWLQRPIYARYIQVTCNLGVTCYMTLVSRCCGHHAFDRAREIADFNFGYFAPQDLDHGGNTQRFAHGVQRGHTWQQHFGVDIQVTQLD